MNLLSIVYVLSVDAYSLYTVSQGLLHALECTSAGGTEADSSLQQHISSTAQDIYSECATQN